MSIPNDVGNAHKSAEAGSITSTMLRRWPIGALAVIVGVVGFFTFAIFDSFRGDASIAYRTLKATGLSDSAYASMSNDEIRNRLTELLHTQPDFTVERPEQRVYRVSGCLVFETRNWGSESCTASPPLDIWKIERRIDLTLVETDPSKRRFSAIGNDPDRSILIMPYRKDVAMALRESYRRHHRMRRRLIAEETATGQFDRAARVKRLHEFARGELSDGPFFRNAQRVHYCKPRGLIGFKPAEPDHARIPGRQLSLAEVSELLDIYAQRLCDPRAR